MKKLIATIALLLITSLSYAAYTLTVTRTEQNIYRTSGGNIILTHFCYEYAYSDTAVLFWDYPVGREVSFGGKLIFSNGESCDVKGVF